MSTEIDLIYPLVLTITSFLAAVFASIHVVLYKRDVRAAIGWVGVIWLTPLIGSLLYLALGINRLQRKAKLKLHGYAERVLVAEHLVATPEDIDKCLGDSQEHLRPLSELVRKVSHRPLLRGNSVEPYHDGDAAYGAMLDAIGKAEQSIGLSTYIFDNDRVGRMFVDALEAAKQRGVEVRVLIDDVGIRYTWPTIASPLRNAGIRFATFLPTLIPWQLHYTNLRSHRKMLIVDGQFAFTGGMNIREGHMPSMKPAHAIQDMHFRLTGPVVAQLQEAFIGDWEFVSGEVLEGERWTPPLRETGSALMRAIPDGPDQHHDKQRLTLMGALGCARTSVLIVTPYFLPDAGLINALNTADLRGVDVKILLPAHNNLALVQWASTAMLWQILEHGVQVHLSQPPFDHTKLMVVDGHWTVFGSSNWDPRSLRLNFEINVECYDRTFAQRLLQSLDKKLQAASHITLADVDSRSFPVRLRDGVARLFSPYL